MALLGQPLPSLFGMEMGQNCVRLYLSPGLDMKTRTILLKLDLAFELPLFRDGLERRHFNGHAGLIEWWLPGRNET
jgi:hypothetical protein